MSNPESHAVGLRKRPARAVLLRSTEVHRSSGDRTRARVKLERRAKGFYIGTSEMGGIPNGDLRCAAEAALQALTQAVSAEGPVSLRLSDIEPFSACGQTAVMVSVDIGYADETRRLLGFSPVDGDGATAAARAVLDATNRVLGIG